MNRIYSIEAGELLIKDGKTGAVVWQGNFNGNSVYKILLLPTEESCLVLLDPGASKEPTFENLLLIDASGKILWKAQLPQTNDAFVDVVLTDTGVEANTWSGFRVTIDINTGRSKKITFTK